MCRTFSGTNTGLTVSGWLVWQWEFSQISSDHVKLDFNWVEDFSAVNSNNVADHLWHNDTVSQMSLDSVRFLSSNTCLLGLNALHVESVISMFDFSVKSSSLSGSEKFNDFFSGEFIDLFRGESSVGVLLKSSLLFLLRCGH